MVKWENLDGSCEDISVAKQNKIRSMNKKLLSCDQGSISSHD